MDLAANLVTYNTRLIISSQQLLHQSSMWLLDHKLSTIAVSMISSRDWQTKSKLLIEQELPLKVKSMVLCKELTKA